MVAVQLFGGAFAFPILSLLSFGYPLLLTSSYATSTKSASGQPLPILRSNQGGRDVAIL